MIDVELMDARDLFVTPEFRRSDWANDLADDVGQVLITRDPMIPGHFGTYFGALQIREYANPYRSDLYHLHELYHLQSWREGRVKVAATGTRETPNAWAQRICLSEKEASLTSEAYAYVLIPGLRKKAFAHIEIWYDRFAERISLSMGADPGAAFCGVKRMLAAERSKVLLSTSYDFVEEQIKHFHYQNLQWCRLWGKTIGGGPLSESPAYRVVEEHMTAMGDRLDLAAHREWLAAVTVTADTPGGQVRLPFARQAIDFLPYYEETKEKYGNEFLET